MSDTTNDTTSQDEELSELPSWLREDISHLAPDTARIEWSVYNFAHAGAEQFFGPSRVKSGNNIYVIGRIVS